MSLYIGSCCLTRHYNAVITAVPLNDVSRNVLSVSRTVCDR